MSKIVKRSVLYLGLALAGLAGISLLVAAKVYTGVDVDKWLAPAVWTTVLCWVVVRQSRQFWGLWFFWATLVALLTLHLLLLVSLVHTHSRISAITFVPFIIVEGGLWGAVLYAVCRKSEQHHRRSHSAE